MLSGQGALRITVLGNFSGRNAGDAAILAGLLRDVTETYPDRKLLFQVPTINPRFVRETYREYPVRAISLLPTNLSLKILGVPVVRSVLGAELVLVTDAILFDRQLYNPLFNYLYTLSWVIPLAARRGVPVVLYNVSLGPVGTPAGRRCLRRVLRASRKVIVRDRESAALARELHPEVGNPVEGADCALSTRPAAEERIADLVRELGLFRSGRPVLGFNVNAYVDTYVRGRERGIGVRTFQDIVASVLDRAARELGADVLLVVTQAMDLPMARQVIRKTRARDRIALVSSPPLHYAEITGLLAKVDAFVGMRTHSVILSSSVHTPVGGIIAYPKTRGYLETIDRVDGVIEFPDFTAENLWRLVKDTWDRRDELRRRLEVSVERERARAAAAALELAEWLGPPANRSESSGAARNRTGSKPIPLQPGRLPAADTRMPQESVYRQPEYAEEYDEDRFGGAFGRYMQDQEVATFLSMAPGPRASILDVGAGTGKLSLAFLGRSRLVVAVDGSREMLRVAGAKARERGVSLASVVCDAQRLCFRDRAFDCAVSSRTLMHLSDWRKAIGELCRVSRCVVLDFPPLLSASGLDALSRRLRKPFSPRVQTYRVFRVREVREEFERRGFRVEVLERRFLLPVAFHRWLDRPRFSAWIERVLGGLCLVWLLGAPVTVKATQQPSRAERGWV